MLTDEAKPARACNDQAATEGRAANYGCGEGLERGSADLERNYMNYVIIGPFRAQLMPRSLPGKLRSFFIYRNKLGR